MKTTPQSTHPAAARRIRFVGTRATVVLPRLLAVTAVGLLSVSACSSTSGTGGANESSNPGSTSRSSQAKEPASQNTGVITEGAADDAWKERARKVAAQNGPRSSECVDGMFDQKTLDAVATALPEVGDVYVNGLFTHAGCSFTATDRADQDLMQSAAEVEIRRYYLSNDEEFQNLDESGYLKHGQCGDDVQKDENGVATVNKHDVRESKIPGPTIAAVELQAAWYCSEGAATSSAVLIHAADGEEDGFADPTFLTESDMATEMATHLADAESDWAPVMDKIYEKYFRDNMGQ